MFSYQTILLKSSSLKRSGVDDFHHENLAVSPTTISSNYLVCKLIFEHFHRDPAGLGWA